MGKTINWKELWNDFENWLTEQEDSPICETCKTCTPCFPSWDDQQEKIKQLVNAQIRKIVKNKS